MTAATLHTGPLVTRSAVAMLEHSVAVYSDDFEHRLTLCRIWEHGEPVVNWLMMNPSTATETKNDPTLARCQTRAERGGFGGVVVTNLFSYRATDPRELRGRDRVNHETNDAHILAAARSAAVVVCAWGSHSFLRELVAARAERVVGMLRKAGVKLHALALNGDGQPRHPLYVDFDLTPQEWQA